LESYVYDDEVLDALCDSVGRPGEKAAVRAIKAQAVQDSVNNRNNLPDDIKSAAGQIFDGVRRHLSITGGGNNAQAFARDTLCPLIKPGMAVYEELRASIFGP
jgi:hypothetical protein